MGLKVEEDLQVLSKVTLFDLIFLHFDASRGFQVRVDCIKLN